MFVIFLYFNGCDREANQHLLIQKHLLLSKTQHGLFLVPTKKNGTRPSLQLQQNFHHITFHQFSLVMSIIFLPLSNHQCDHLCLVLNMIIYQATQNHMICQIIYYLSFAHIYAHSQIQTCQLHQFYQVICSSLVIKVISHQVFDKPPQIIGFSCVYLLFQVSPILTAFEHSNYSSKN